MPEPNAPSSHIASEQDENMRHRALNKTALSSSLPIGPVTDVFEVLEHEVATANTFNWWDIEETVAACS